MTTLHLPPASTDLLLEHLRERACDPSLLAALDERATERRWVCVDEVGGVQLWLIHWPAGAVTGWHDHGTASGAFTVLRGALQEHAFDGALRLRDLGAGEVRAFGSGHVHDVRNRAETPALSLHAYAPRLESMTRYEFLGDRLAVVGVERAGREW